MARKQPRARYITIPNACLVSANFASLSRPACKLFLDLAAQCYGYNNGDLSMVWPDLQKRGWRSKATWNEARKELLEKGWIVQTRQGWNNRCSLYGFTFMKIGDFGGKKLDLVNEGAAATNDWKRWSPN